MKLGLWLAVAGGVLSAIAVSVLPWQTFELAAVTARGLELGALAYVMTALALGGGAAALWGIASGRRKPASGWALAAGTLLVVGVFIARAESEWGLELMPRESIAIGAGWALALVGAGLLVAGAVITRWTLCAWDESSPLLRVCAVRMRADGRREVVVDRILYWPQTLSVRELIAAGGGGAGALVELPRVTVSAEGDAWYALGERRRVALPIGAQVVVRCDDIEVMCGHVVPSGVLGGRVATQTLSRAETWGFGAVGLVLVIGLALMPILTWTEEAVLAPACERDGMCAGVVARAEADAPEEVVELTIPDEVGAHEDESASKAIGGPEGRLGDPTIATPREVKVPRVEGPKITRVDPRKLGINAVIERQIADATSVAEVFRGDLAATTSRIAAAMDGEGTELVLGPGTGLGFEGDGEGGPGDDGPGRLLAMGDIDRGPGGPEIAVNLGKPPKRKAKLEERPFTQHGYCKESNIQSVVRRRAGAIRACYEKRLQLVSALAGKLTVRWTVDLDGRVQNPTAVADTLGDAETTRCVLSWVRRMTFDAPDGGMCVVQWPFAFSSSP